MPANTDRVQVFQPWSCDLCGEYGTVEAMSDWDAGEVMAAAREQHAFGSTCPGRLRFFSKWREMNEIQRATARQDRSAKAG